MRREEMNSSGSAGQRATSLPPLLKQSFGAGQVTRVDGLTGQFREQQGGAKTQHLTAMTTRKPATNDPDDQKKMKTGRLGKSQVLEKPPQPAIEVQGGMEMFWDEVEEKTEEEELSPEEGRKREMVELQREEGQAWMDLLAAVAKTQTLARTKNSLFMEQGEAGIARGTTKT